MRSRVTPRKRSPSWRGEGPARGARRPPPDLAGVWYGVTGRSADAHAELRGLEQRSRQQYVSPQHFAVVHLGLGHKQEAFTFLEEAYEQRAIEVLGFWGRCSTCCTTSRDIETSWAGWAWPTRTSRSDAPIRRSEPARPGVEAPAPTLDAADVRLRGCVGLSGRRRAGRDAITATSSTEPTTTTTWPASGAEARCACPSRRSGSSRS